MSLRDKFYNIYDKIAGKNPNCNILHYCWLGAKDLNRDLREVLPSLKGKLLDVGCGDKPYKYLLTNVDEHLGLDVYKDKHIDIVVERDKEWPIKDNEFDSIISTQALEHVDNLDLFLKEIFRILKPNGKVVITLPFIECEHAMPYDYRRFSANGIRYVMEKMGYEIVEIRKQGGFGSSFGFMFLAFIFSFKFLRTLFALLMPIWFVITLKVNIIGWIIDKLDHSQAFYPNLMVIATKSDKYVKN